MHSLQPTSGTIGMLTEQPVLISEQFLVVDQQSLKFTTLMSAKPGNSGSTVGTAMELDWLWTHGTQALVISVCTHHTHCTPSPPSHTTFISFFRSLFKELFSFITLFSRADTLALSASISYTGVHKPPQCTHTHTPDHTHIHAVNTAHSHKMCVTNKHMPNCPVP